MEPAAIRNFVIISHVDHGKSTLADRFLELTGTIEPRKMQPQYLDRMDLERERGITIKMQPVRMIHRPPTAAGRSYVLNLIDTPGHADFAYEVSRALAAVEGAILLVDATQGVQAQTVSNLYLAQRQGLTIIPVINKIDLPGADAPRAASELVAVVGCDPSAVRAISAKTGQGVPELLEAVVARVPPPTVGGGVGRALVFDSAFDPYRGVIAHVRVFDGVFRAGDAIRTAATGRSAEVMEVGWFSPEMARAESLVAGEIGYLATGLKEPDAIRVGDTIAGVSKVQGFKVEVLPGYREPQPVVFASVYPEDADAFERLSDALSKMKLSDAALVFEPESSEALGRGFRVGFLGLLHMDIARERLRREYGLELLLTVPSVAYRVTLADGREQVVSAAARVPDGSSLRAIAEPWARLDAIVPSASFGAVMELLSRTRGRYRSHTSLASGRLVVVYEAPLRDVIVDFSDALKRVTAGYGSYSYEPIGYRPSDLVRLDILVAGRAEEALAEIVPRAEAYRIGRRIVEKLASLLPRELFSVSLQAALGGRVIARETLPALKRDVAGYLYGGDRTRKMKLWSKQQRGKARLKEAGRVRIPPEVFRELLRR